MKEKAKARVRAVVVAGFVLFKYNKIFKNKEQKWELLFLIKNILSLAST